MSITRRSLFASLGVALPVALTALGAKAATAPAPHHAKKHRGHAASMHAPHHRTKTHHTTAALKHPQPQA